MSALRFDGLVRESERIHMQCHDGAPTFVRDQAGHSDREGRGGDAVELNGRANSPSGANERYRKWAWLKWKRD